MNNWPFFKRRPIQRNSLESSVRKQIISSYPRKRKDEKNLYNSVKGKRHLLHRVTFKIERPDIWKLIKNALKIEHSVNSDLTVFQFCMIAFAQHRSMFHMEYVFHLSLKYGVVLTMFIYMLGTFLISMPLYMILLSMASYSKKGPVAFWDCAPLMKGYAYSWALSAIMQIVIQLRYACGATYRLLIMSELRSSMKCKHKSAPGYSCIPAKNNRTKVLSTNCTALYSMLAYAEGNLELTFTSKLNVFNTICSVVLMIFVIWLSIRGLNATKILLQVLVMLCQGLICIIILATILTSMKHKVSIDIFTMSHDPLFNLDYWSAVTPLSIQVLKTGDTIWLGRFKPRMIRPDVFVILLHIFKYVYFVFMYFWMARVVQDIAANYGTSPTCMNTERFSFVLVAIPDMLLRHYPSGFACIIWYFAVAALSIVTSCYGMICLLDGFLELKTLQNKKKYFVLVVFILATGYNILCGYCRATKFRKYWREFFTRPWLCFQFFALCTSTIHVYSIRRFMNDYQFTYRDLPGRIWIAMWRGISIYVLVLVVVAAHWLLTLIAEISGPNFLLICYPTIMWMTVCMPTIVIIVFHSCKYLKKHAIYLSTLPLPSWRPFKQEDWVRRMRFLPDRDIKYRHKSVTCIHVCLVKLKKFREEKAIQTAQFNKLVSNFDGDFDKYGDTLSSEEEEFCPNPEHVLPEEDVDDEDWD